MARWWSRILCPAGAFAVLSAQGVMAGGSQFPGRAAMPPGDLAAVPVRFEAHTGHQGTVAGGLRHARRVTREQGMYWNEGPAASAPSGAGTVTVQGAVTAVDAQPGTAPVRSGSISVQTSSGVSIVNLAPTATIEQAGQTLARSQVSAGEEVRIALNSGGEGQVVDVAPAGTVAPAPTGSTAAATRGTVVSLSGAELTIQPQARGSAQVSYTLSPSEVVTAQDPGSSLGDVATGDLIQVHLSGGAVTRINLLATAGSTTGTIASALDGAFIVTEPTGQTARVVLRPCTTVAVDGVDLPHGALARGEEVAVTGTSRGSSLAASSVTITGDSTPGAP